MICLIDTPEVRIHNLRHELARNLWAARQGNIDLLEANDNIRSLVALCPDHVAEKADLLAHAVKNQIQKIQGNHYYRMRGVDQRIRVHAVRVARNVN